MQDLGAAPSDEMLDMMLEDRDVWDESGPAPGVVLTDVEIVAPGAPAPLADSQGASLVASSSVRSVGPKRSSKAAAKGRGGKGRGRAHAASVAQSSVEGVAVPVCDVSGSDSGSSSDSSSSSSDSSSSSSSSSQSS